MDKQQTKAQLIGKLIAIFIIDPLIGGALLSVVLPYSFWDCYILGFAIMWLVASAIHASNSNNKQ